MRRSTTEPAAGADGQRKGQDGQVSVDGVAVPYPTHRTVVRLFCDQARATPHRPALTSSDMTLTYGELARSARALAQALGERGVGKGCFLPLVMDGGLALPIAMVAAMTLGAPFVPVDEAWPRARVAEVVAQLAPPVVLTSGPAGAWRDLDVPVRRVGPHADPSADLPPAGDPGPTATVHDLVYGFFTSGTTGTPKCALNRHLGLLNRFLYMTRRFGRDHVVLQNSPHVFDSSLWQLLWPLTNGGRVVLPRRDGILDLYRTVDLIAQHAVTMTDFVPSVFNTLVELLVADRSLRTGLVSLRHLLIGGEEINPRAVRTFRALLPQVRVTNTYGPTEASIGSVFHEVTDADADSVPIGRPIDNTYVAILDERGEPVPRGGTGEIYIGGDCVGAGYLNDPERTAAAFVRNPLREVPGPVLYRTGDLGRRRADGPIMFLGRRDQQVKLGGVRIELLEVEAVIATHPGVREAKAAVCGDGDAQALVCFAVVHDGATARPADLAAHARERLPAPSVPNRFVLVDRLPLTSNGKVDRRALARMAVRRPSPTDDGTSTGPDSPMPAAEDAVRRIWLALLPMADVGRSDDFFACGGTSLTLYRLAQAIQDRFEVRLPIRDLAAAPTIRDQAALVASQRRAPVDPSALLRREIRLPRDVTRVALRPVHRRSAPRQVLLTGATGFIGLHLLAELLERTAATVHCLVRAGTAERARERLASALRRLDRDADLSRVVAVSGDLTRPHLGLEPHVFAALADSVDTVVHGAAIVNRVVGYPALRGTNVDGTVEVLRLVARGVPKHLHHLSTLSVFPAGTGVAPVHEEDEPGSAGVPRDGYSQSKWVAEQILGLARERGVPSTVYRLGEVMPHSRSGLGNERSAIHALLRTCARLGLRFATPVATDWTPVDRVSRFVVEVLSGGLVPDHALHLVQPTSVRLSAMFTALGREVPLRKVSYREFWRAVDAGAGADNELARLLTLLPEPHRGRHPEHLAGLIGDATAVFATERSRRLADKLGIGWSPVDDHALRAHARWVVRGVDEITNGDGRPWPASGEAVAAGDPQRTA